MDQWSILSKCISYTGGSHLSQIFWEHEILSCISVIWLIYIKLYKEKEKENWQKIQAKWESGLTAVWLKQDPPVSPSSHYMTEWL